MFRICVCTSPVNNSRPFLLGTEAVLEIRWPWCHRCCCCCLLPAARSACCLMGCLRCLLDRTGPLDQLGLVAARDTGVWRSRVVDDKVMQNWRELLLLEFHTAMARPAHAVIATCAGG